MKKFTLLAAIAILALPAFADDRGRGHGYGRQNRVYGGPIYPAYPSAYADPYYGNYALGAPYGPPALRMERRGPCPGPGYVWVDGFWRWGGAGYVWAPGFWTRPPRPYARWEAGGWYGGPRGFSFRGGFWR